MRPRLRTAFAAAPRARQRGVALFFALICMVSIMLAALVLVRSVDTATLIAGNLAFQQAATRSGDAGTEAAIPQLMAMQTSTTANVLNDPSHPFNNDNAAQGYFSSLDPTICMTGAYPNSPCASPGNGGTYGSNFNWTGNSVTLPADAVGNTVQYVIQRMCQGPTGLAAGKAVQDTNCLFSGALVDNNGQNIPLPQQICNGPGCPTAGQTPMLRVTSKIIGPNNTVSYVQSLIY